MRYAKIVFDTKELMQDAPRKELAAAGAACETGPAREGALFVSADPEAVDAAFAAGFPCALALWTGVPARHARATHYLRAPYELVDLLTRREDVYDGLEWMKTAVEMQFIAQAGLAYSKDPYDIERFARLRELAAEMLARGSGLPDEDRARRVPLRDGLSDAQDRHAGRHRRGRPHTAGAGKHRPVGAARRLDGRGHHHLPKHRQGGV